MKSVSLLLLERVLILLVICGILQEIKGGKWLKYIINIHDFQATF